MVVDKKNLEKLKQSLEEANGHPVSDEDVKKAADFLELLAEISVKQVFREADWKNKLQTSPEGFHLEESHKCCICGHIADAKDTWYDKDGIKCMACQNAINKGVIPASIATDDTSYYSEYDLEHCFTLKGKILNAWIKKGIIKARVILALNKGVQARLFLIKDNKGFLPPKSLVKSGMVKEEIDGKTEYVGPVPWYRLCEDPVKKLHKYGISQYFLPG